MRRDGTHRVHHMCRAHRLHRAHLVHRAAAAAAGEAGRNEDHGKHYRNRIRIRRRVLFAVHFVAKARRRK
jgi:hypothetical protein